MPRQARIDLPGQLYHVMARGLEKRELFKDKADYVDFLRRFSSALNKCDGKCYAWCLMPNHFHLLILRGSQPLADIMRSTMTGYAVSFNLRHERVGHLFQNRYKAILCSADEYFMELIAYIHLNPLRAKLVGSFDILRNYPWCGHGGVMGVREDYVLARGDVLEYFGGSVDKYECFLRERFGAPCESSEGAIMRVGASALETMRNPRSGNSKVSPDSRVMGGSSFVEDILKKADEQVTHIVPRADIIKIVNNLTGVSEAEILSTSRARRVALARGVYCYLMKRDGGADGGMLMQELKLSSGAVSFLVKKGGLFLKK